jgi:hypothetical protein
LPVQIGPGGESPRPRVSSNRSGGVRLKPNSRWNRAPGRVSGSGVSRFFRNVRSGQGLRGLTELGTVANSHPRALAWRNLGRFAHIHRGFQARSPPGCS